MFSRIYSVVQQDSHREELIEVVRIGRKEIHSKNIIIISMSVRYLL